MEYQALTAKDFNKLEEIVQMERKYYGKHALGSIDMFAQIVDEKLGASGTVIAAMDNGNVIGYYLTYNGKNKNCCFAAHLVEEEYRGKGYGTELQENMIRRMAEQGFEKGVLTICPSNHTNLVINLNKLGWNVTGYTKNKYGEGEHRFYLEGELTKHFTQEKDWRSKIPEINGITIADENNLETVQKTREEFIMPLDKKIDYSNVDWNIFNGKKVLINCVDERYLLFSRKK